ncbi:MAG: branched-chain amino acid ABC transporter permease [Rhodospirillaceae bacterium]
MTDTARLIAKFKLSFGVTGIRNAFGSALWFGLTLLIGLIRVMGNLPERLLCATIEFWTDLMAATTWQGRLLGCGLLLGLATLPNWAGASLLPMMISVLWFAYVGQAWNILAGFVGQFSLGHALFVGVGAYLAGGTMVYVGGGPGFGLGLGLGLVVAAALGAAIGALGFRKGMGVNHFALLTVVAVELARLCFTQFDGLRLGIGRALPPSRLLILTPTHFYYIILALTVLLLLFCRILVRSRLGRAWLALREAPIAAAATGINVFRAKLAAVMISAAFCAVAGAFQAISVQIQAAPALDPGRVFSFTGSVEIALGVIVGGTGTLVGPLLGALVLTPFGEGLNLLAARTGHGMLELKPLCYGLILVLVEFLRPAGLWPWLGQRLRLVPGGDLAEGGRR